MKNSPVKSDLRSQLVEHPCIIYALRNKVARYYQDPENRARFERWYLEKYGTPYVWNDEPPR